MSGKNSQCEPSRFYLIYVQSSTQSQWIKVLHFCKRPTHKNHFSIVKNRTMGRCVGLTMKTWSFSLAVSSYITPTSHLLCCLHRSVGCRMVSTSFCLWKLLPLISVDDNGSDALLALSLAPCCLPDHHQQW